jgi:LexA-binding, inner membrane-associated putative hydrolase
MYIGHVGAALAAKRARRSIGLLVLLVATYTPDWVDTGLCLAGAYNPEGMLSHSIPAIALLALVGFAAYAIATRDWTAALVVAAVIVSHMFLDWITGYKPTWLGGPMIGLRLYDHPIADFIAEGVVIGIGALFYARTLPPRRRPWIDVSIMVGALLALQLGIDIAHIMMKSLPKC